jgi:hypothetical protein
MSSKKQLPGRPIEGLGIYHFGPGSEQAFKVAVIHAQASEQLRIFEVENEEKEAGFPDSLEMYMAVLGEGLSPAQLVEYKVSDIVGYIDFQPRQPLFYARNDGLAIVVRAWSVPDQKAYEYDASVIFKALSKRAKAGENPLRLYINGGKAE